MLVWVPVINISASLRPSASGEPSKGPQCPLNINNLHFQMNSKCMGTRLGRLFFFFLSPLWKLPKEQTSAYYGSFASSDVSGDQCTLCAVYQTGLALLPQDVLLLDLEALEPVRSLIRFEGTVQRDIKMTIIFVMRWSHGLIHLPFLKMFSILVGEKDTTITG